jgi:ElaB/YqjD/DUF883 family membrane-anchored ribosome-binding protein
MAKKPNDVEREIEEQRELISRKLDGLHARLERDIEDVKNGVSERTSGLRDGAGSWLDLDNRVREYPLASMAGALGVGVLLGLSSDMIGGGERTGRREQRSHAAGDGRGYSGPGPLGNAVGSLTGMIGGLIQEEFRGLVQEGLEGFSEQRQRRRREPARQDY